MLSFILLARRSPALKHGAVKEAVVTNLSGLPFLGSALCDPIGSNGRTPDDVDHMLSRLGSAPWRLVCTYL